MSGENPIVDLGYARYHGTTLDIGVNQYLGMRFAAPPVGDLRFRAPEDPEKTLDIQDATSFGLVCLGEGIPYPSLTESEDCLFINVFTPSNATTESKLPVWFFIQGGGYNLNFNANYNGTEVIHKSGDNIVFVNFNYRVAAYGFLASEKIRKDGDLNAGLLDMRKALLWVQKYIHLFGGDPKHVVIHGDSAGAGAVAMLLLAYGGRNDGLFHGGIGTSIFFPIQPKVKDLEWQFDRFSIAAGCGNETDQLRCLRSKDTATLQAANQGSPYPGRSIRPLWYFTPTVDGDFLQDYPYRQFAQEKFIKVPTIWGDETDEGSYFGANATSPTEVTEFMTNNFPKLSENDAKIIDKLYPLMSPVPHHNAYFPSASAAYGECALICPGLYVSAVLARHQKLWNYRCNIVDDANVAAGLGVPHVWVLPAVFGVGNLGIYGVGTGYETYNAPIVPVVMNYFISFVRTLDPNTLKYPGAPNWEGFEEGHRRLKMQTNATRMESVPKQQSERCRYWTEVGVKLEQ
ncbi:Esta [Wilcoxina mikolae CBS 423.85]|nr:Esta [Wilcoxina mikolae CBS 423.85]